MRVPIPKNTLLQPRLPLLAPLAIVCAFGFAPAAKAACTGPTPKGLLPAAEAYAVSDINYQRLQQGLGPLHISPTLTAATEFGGSPDSCGNGVYGAGGGNASGPGVPNAFNALDVGTFLDPTITAIGITMTYDRSADHGAVSALVSENDDSGIDSSHYLPPVTAPDRASVAYDSVIDPFAPHPINVTGNDRNPRKTGVYLVAVADSVHGVAEIADAHSLFYQPNARFHGIDTVHYTVADLYGASSEGVLTITVRPNTLGLRLHVDAKISHSAMHELKLFPNYPLPLANGHPWATCNPPDTGTVHFQLYRKNGNGWTPLGKPFSAKLLGNEPASIALLNRLYPLLNGTYQLRAAFEGFRALQTFSVVA
jgi:hypothetical protein